MASIGHNGRVVLAKTGGELALSTVRGVGGSMPLEAVWCDPEATEPCLKVVHGRIDVMGDCQDLNGVNRTQCAGGVGGNRYRIGPEDGEG